MTCLGCRSQRLDPDPEQRHGWREVYVRREPEQKPGAGIGFRKPRPDA